MSYFDNINFEESTLLEGQQADAYKAKKANEKDRKESRDAIKKEWRYGDKPRRNPYAPTQEPGTTTEKPIKGRKSGNTLEKYTNDAIRKDKVDSMISKDTLGKAAQGAKSSISGDKSKAKDYANQIKNVKVNRDVAADAANRHMRRHPKQYKEAAELAESLLESYQPDCIYC